MFLFFLTYTSVAHLPFPPLHASVTRYTQQRTCQLMSHVSLFFSLFLFFPFLGYLFIFFFISFSLIGISVKYCRCQFVFVNQCSSPLPSLSVRVSYNFYQLLFFCRFVCIQYFSRLSHSVFFSLSLSLTTYIYFYLCQSARPSPASCHSYSCKQIFFYDSRPVDSKSHVVSARGGDVLESQRVLSGGSMGRRERLCYSWPTSLTITGVPFFCFPLTPIP